MSRTLIWAFLLTLLSLPPDVAAQALRYQTLHAQISIPGIEAYAAIEATYGVSPTRPSQRELRFLARGLDIHSVAVNGTEAEFQVHLDTLVVRTSAPLRLASRNRVKISYVTPLDHGVHRWPKSVLWTSLVPGSITHWLPVPLETNVALTTDFAFDIPETWKAIAPGLPVASYTPYARWESAEPLAIETIRFAAGELELQVTDEGMMRLVLPDDRWEPADAHSAVDVRFLNRSEVRSEGDPDRLRLALDIREDGEQEVLITVRLLSGRARGRITLPLRQIVGGTIIPSPLTVASAGDEIRMSTAMRLDNLTVADEFADIDIVESKPGRFWLFQLRTSTDPEKRRIAAEALGMATDAPDIALALSSFYRQEPDPKVKAALLASYAAQSAGRIGSHPLILSAIREKGELRLVAMRELGRYSNSEPVREAVSQVIRSSDDVDLVNEALKSYRRLVAQDVSDDLMRRLLNEDVDGDFATVIFDAFEGRPEAAMLTQRAKTYLDPKFSWEVRKRALSILTATEKDSSYWRDVFARHAEDPDPRFRNALLGAVSLLSAEDRASFVRNRLQAEYDPRIRDRIPTMD